MKSRIMPEVKSKEIEVLDIRKLTPSAYVLKMGRNDLDFTAGQHITLGQLQNIDSREYSIYSGEQDEYLEVLIKEVIDGHVSKKLKQVSQGDRLMFDGPVGYFTLNPDEINQRKFYFIASGTGIAPFRSFVRSYPNLDYTLLHGVKYASEAYDRLEYDPDRHVLCTSQDSKGDFNGRVTEYIRENVFEPNALYYLCGNINMIYEVFDILKLKGVPSNQLHAEVYF
ncbi:MAG: ferredoxin--NADP reductase [Bacteroidota bacterium]